MWPLWRQCSLINEDAIRAGWRGRILRFPKYASWWMAWQFLPVTCTSQFFRFSRIHDVKKRKHKFSIMQIFLCVFKFLFKLSSVVWFFRVFVFLVLVSRNINITTHSNYILIFFISYMGTNNKCLWVCFQYSSFSFFFCTWKDIDRRNEPTEFA